MSEIQLYGPHWVALPINDWMRKQDGVIHISARALNIIWGNDPRFWQWMKLPKEESEFEVGAELLQVNWIDVTGKLDFHHLLPAFGTYEIFYIVKFKVDAFGWYTSPIKFKVSTTDGKKCEVSEMLENYRKVTDKLHEIRGGEFTVPSGAMKGSVQFGMYEIESDGWKGSMILEGIKIKPKNVIQHVPFQRD